MPVHSLRGRKLAKDRNRGETTPPLTSPNGVESTSVVDTTMALPAGYASSGWIKAAPRICRRSFISDWERFKLFIKVNRVPQEEASEGIPLLLEDNLFLIYQQAAARTQVVTLEAAEKILKSLIGAANVTCISFTNRKWSEGRETIQMFLCELQNMVSVLKLPPDMVKAQFVSGLSDDVVRSISLFDGDNVTCEQLAALAEKIVSQERHGTKDHLAIASEKSVLTIEGSLGEQLRELKLEVAALKESREMEKRNPMRCFKCNGMGHMARDCKLVICHACGERGHVKYNCPKNVYRPAH